MTVDKLSRLVAALGGSAQGNQQTTTTKELEKPQTSSQGDEAVQVAKSFGAPGNSADARSQRVQELKRAVEEKTYKPNLRAVAEAVAQELFF